MSTTDLLTRVVEAMDRHSEALEAFIAATGAKPAATAAATTSETPARRGRPAKDKTEAKSDAKTTEPASTGGGMITDAELTDEFKSFMNYGEDDNEDDQKIRDAREAFAFELTDFLNVEAIVDIQPADRAKVLGWLRMREKGQDVDFNAAPATPAGKRRPLL